jgi:hypothetical protein
MEYDLLERMNKVSLRVARALEESERLRAIIAHRIIEDGFEQEEHEEDEHQEDEDYDDDDDEDEDEDEDEEEEEKVQDNELSACWFCCRNRR